MSVTLVELTNTDHTFYPTLGPFLARREVHAYLGGNVWDDDAKTWIVARHRRRTVGFVAVAARGRRWLVESLYITPDAPQGTGEALAAAAVARCGPAELHAIARHAHAGPYLAVGFTITSQTKEFARMTRPAQQKEVEK
ncbi:hypothetical protein [Marinactinospora rubrisoli]|uniref:N-acetyltransferase domain-containing protein n=1 Tax=Marinactinospora rubrisoli TaxID=2715399 RepID=A0ABW2KN16_9ACTN